jgi:hypothetical protein
LTSRARCRNCVFPSAFCWSVALLVSFALSASRISDRQTLGASSSADRWSGIEGFAAGLVYPDFVMEDQPAGYWRLGETTGTMVADTSGHNLVGSYSGGVSLGATGAVSGDSNSAATFDGTSGSAALGDSALLQTANVSVEAWVKTTASGAGTQQVVRKRLYGYSLQVDTGTGLPGFWVYSGSLNTAQKTLVTGTGRVTDGTWHHLVGTYDGSNVELYVDGGVAGTVAAVVSGGLTYQPGGVAIGRDGDYAGAYFQGSLDEVAIYPTALSATRIATHFTAGSGKTPPLTATPPATPLPAPTGVTQTLTPVQTPPSEPEIANPGRGQYLWDTNSPQPSDWPALDSYMRFAWRDLESCQGCYDFSQIDGRLSAAAARGGRFGFGVMAASSPSGSAVPQYLMDAMPAGFWFRIDPASNQQTYAPDWNNPAFLERAQALMTALSNRFADDSRVGWLDIGLYGDWGEWHVARWPYGVDELDAQPITPANARRLVDMQVQAFPNKHLLMLTANVDALRYALSLSPLIGWRNNCLGTRGMGGMAENPEVLTLLEDRWKTAPVITEYCRSARSGDGTFELARSQVQKYHVSLVSNNGVNNWASYTPQQQAAFEQANKLAGYRFVLDSVDSPPRLQPGTSFLVTTRWSNVGVTPTYDPWAVTVQLRRPTTGDVVWQEISHLDLRQLLPTVDALSGSDAPVAIQDTFTLPDGLVPDTYDLVLTILDPGHFEAPLALAIRGSRPDGSYPLGTLTVAAGA